MKEIPFPFYICSVATKKISFAFQWLCHFSYVFSHPLADCDMPLFFVNLIPHSDLSTSFRCTRWCEAQALKGLLQHNKVQQSLQDVHHDIDRQLHGNTRSVESFSDTQILKLVEEFRQGPRETALTLRSYRIIVDTRIQHLQVWEE